MLTVIKLLVIWLWHNSYSYCSVVADAGKYIEKAVRFTVSCWQSMCDQRVVISATIAFFCTQ